MPKRPVSHSKQGNVRPKRAKHSITDKDGEVGISQLRQQLVAIQGALDKLTDDEAHVVGSGPTTEPSVAMTQEASAASSESLSAQL